MALPIILAHGIARFDFLAREFGLSRGEGDAADRIHYFRRIRSTLLAEGFDTHHSDVSFARGDDIRSRELRANVVRVLQETGAPQVHIIAHSMGGLDARHMLFDGRDEGFHSKIASLTTLGTPHLGTSFADWGIRHARGLLRLLEFVGIDSIDGFKDLTTDACLEFDAKARAFEESCGVLFQTIAGSQEVWRIFAPLQFSWFVINEREGENDGFVAVESAKWREPYFRQRIDADHLNQIGWWDPSELSLRFFPSRAATRLSRREMERGIRDLYVELARDLGRRFP